MSDSCYDLTNTPIEVLRADLAYLRREKNAMSVQDGPTARKYRDIMQDINDIHDELDRRAKQ